MYMYYGDNSMKGHLRLLRGAISESGPVIELSPQYIQTEYITDFA